MKICVIHICNGMWALCGHSSTWSLKVVNGKACCLDGHQKDTCYDEIGLCAHNVRTIQVSVVNTSQHLSPKGKSLGFHMID
jgi:hypothetical protein